MNFICKSPQWKNPTSLPHVDFPGGSRRREWCALNASRLGWWGLAGTVVYERASFVTDGFGTDPIIENQKIYEKNNH